MDRFIRLLHTRAVAALLAVSALCAFLVVWPKALSGTTIEFSGMLAAWMQAIGSLLAIGAAVNIARNESKARSQDDRARKGEETRLKRMNYSIAQDIFDDTIYHARDCLSKRNNILASITIDENCRVFQDMTFKPLPNERAAKDVFEIRTMMFELKRSAMLAEYSVGNETAWTALEEVIGRAETLLTKPRDDDGPLLSK